MYQVLPECCQSAMNSYCLTVTNTDGNEVTVTSPCVKCDDNSANLSVKTLNLNFFFNFIIKSSNSIGVQTTALVSFCKQYLSNVYFLVIDFTLLVL